MRILFFCSNTPYSELIPGSKFGGAELSLRLISEMLATKGHEVFFISTSKIKDFVKEVNGVKVHHYNYLKIPKLDKKFKFFSRFNFYLMERKISKLIEDIVEEQNIDIIHTYLTYPDTYIISKIKAGKSFKLVQRVAGKVWKFNWNNDIKLQPKILEAFRSVDHFIPNSSYNHKSLSDFLLENHINKKNKMKILDIGIRISEKISQDKINETKDNVIVCVQKFKTHQKRQDILVKSLKILKDRRIPFHCHLIGSGETFSNIKRLITKLNLSKEITMHGHLDRHNLLSIVKSSSLFVHPSEFEGLSKAIAEAMYLGKTIIASKSPGITDYLTQDNSILVENDPVLFADAIESFLLNKEQFNELGNNAKRYAKDNFSPEKNLKKYENFFSNIIIENYEK